MFLNKTWVKVMHYSDCVKKGGGVAVLPHVQCKISSGMFENVCLAKAKSLKYPII